MVSFSSMPTCGRANVFGSFIEYPKEMKTVTQFPSVLVNRFEPHGLFCQDFLEVKQLAAPLDFTVMTHSPDRDPRLVFHLREFGRIGARRGAIDTPRRFSSQRLMRALPVIFLHKRIILALLLWQIALRRYSLLQGSMHSLMTAVLSRFPRPDPLRLDPKLDPPFRELAEPAQGQRREGRSDRKSTRLNSSHRCISYAVFC